MTDQPSLFPMEPPKCVYELAETPLPDVVVSLLVEAQKNAVAIRTEVLEMVVDVANEPEDDGALACVKCGKRATVYSPRGTGYCLEHSHCGGCSESVEFFVPWQVGEQEIYVCECVVRSDRELKVLQAKFDREKTKRRLRLLA